MVSPYYHWTSSLYSKHPISKLKFQMRGLSNDDGHWHSFLKKKPTKFANDSLLDNKKWRKKLILTISSFSSFSSNSLDHPRWVSMLSTSPLRIYFYRLHFPLPHSTVVIENGIYLGSVYVRYVAVVVLFSYGFFSEWIVYDVRGVYTFWKWHRVPCSCACSSRIISVNLNLLLSVNRLVGAWHISVSVCASSIISFKLTALTKWAHK